MFSVSHKIDFDSIIQNVFKNYEKICHDYFTISNKYMAPFDLRKKYTISDVIQYIQKGLIYCCVETNDIQFVKCYRSFIEMFSENIIELPVDEEITYMYDLPFNMKNNSIIFSIW